MIKNNRNELINAKRIVVKIGSNLVAKENGKINTELLDNICREIAELSAEEKQIIFVTSGAVRIGLAKMGIDPKKNKPDLSIRQTAAAVGQVELISYYNDTFLKEGACVAQLLLTGDDITNRQRYLHIRNTLLPIFTDHKIIPVINENDSVSIEGVQIGENDRLAALIAGKIECDLLIILSDVDGLYTKNPAIEKNAELIREVDRVTDDILKIAGGSISGVGKGGMQSKVVAAKTAAMMGTNTIVALGRETDVLKRIINGEKIGTCFYKTKQNRLHAKKQWVGFAAKPKGFIYVDDGAKTALLHHGSSLLPVGVKSASGNFASGDVVNICCGTCEIARGLTNYSSDEINKIAGQKSKEIEKILGSHPYDEVIHRDNLILL